MWFGGVISFGRSVGPGGRERGEGRVVGDG